MTCEKEKNRPGERPRRHTLEMPWPHAWSSMGRAREWEVGKSYRGWPERFAQFLACGGGEKKKKGSWQHPLAGALPRAWPWFLGRRPTPTCG